MYHFTYTFSYAHTEAHTQTHMYNQHTRGMATTRHKSLVEGGGRKAFVRHKGLAHTQKSKKKKNEKRMSGNPDIHESKEKDSST